MITTEDERRLLDALGQGSSLQLYRLGSMIDSMLADPKRIIEIRRLLHLGQPVRYLDLTTGQMCAATVVELKDREVVVKDAATGRLWRLSYAAVEPPVEASGNQAAASPEPPKPELPRREQFQRGQKVSFDDKHLRTQVGIITRINQRTASVDTGDGMLWKVSFALLRYVVDV